MGARRWSANGALVAAGSLVLTIVGACTSISSAAQRQVERATLVTKPARSVTPTDIGVPSHGSGSSTMVGGSRRGLSSALTP